jgi:hypothetical protein
MERNEKMKSAVEKGDLSKVATAQLIIDTATTKTGEYPEISLSLLMKPFVLFLFVLFHQLLFSG